MKHNILKESIKDAKELSSEEISNIKAIHDMKLREEELKQKYEELVLKKQQIDFDRKFKWDWNMLANGVISITTVLLVLNYEESNIITSKSWNIANKWIGRGK